MENDQVKLLWDFRNLIQTDHHLEHNRPDIVVLEKASRACQIIDVVCSFHTRIVEKDREKINHYLYQDLKVEIQKMWNCKSVSVVPIVIIGALGAVTKNLMMWVTKIGTPGILNLFQKTCLLGTAKISKELKKDPTHLRL